MRKPLSKTVCVTLCVCAQFEILLRAAISGTCPDQRNQNMNWVCSHRDEEAMYTYYKHRNIRTCEFMIQVQSNQGKQCFS
jgi:hypothetical protein